MLRLREDDLSWREVDGEVIVLDERDWTYLHLNGSGSLLWGGLVDGATQEQLEELLTGQFEIASDIAQRDVGQFLEDLRSRELIAT